LPPQYKGSPHLKNMNINYLLLSTYIILSTRALCLNILCHTGASVTKKSIPIIVKTKFLLLNSKDGSDVCPKRRLTFNRSDGVISQKTILRIFNFCTMRIYKSTDVHFSRSRDRVVGIATDYGLDDRVVGVQVPVGIRIFFKWSRPALGSTQPPIHGVKRPRREADHLPPTSAKVKKMWSYTSTPPYTFTA
jgi:hypothetical protein